MAAMVAHQHAAEAVFHQPGRALRALILVATGPAQRQRRIAAPVEEEQRLLAAIERGKDFPGEPRRDPAALFRPLLAHVDGGDIGQLRRREPPQHPHMPVAAEIGVVARFDRGRRRGENRPGVGEVGPDHRHIAGVVVDPIGLLEGAVMLLVEHDHAQLPKRQEQRRTRPHHRPHVALEHAAPDPPALRRGHVGMPFGRARAETAGEAVEEGMG